MPTNNGRPTNGTSLGRLRSLIGRLSLGAADIAALLAAFCLAYLLRSRVLPLVLHFDQPPLALLLLLERGFLLVGLVIIIVFSFEKLYTRRSGFWAEAKHLTEGITLSFVVLVVVIFVSRQFEQFSRAVFVLAWLFSLFLFPLFRQTAKRILLHLGLWNTRIFILGTDRAGELLAEEIRKNRTLGYEAVGFLTDRPDEVGSRIAGCDVIGEIGQFEALSARLGVRDVIIAFPHGSQKKIVQLIGLCENKAETIRIIPNVGYLLTTGVEAEYLGDILSLAIPQKLLRPWNIGVKFAFEFLLVAAATTLLVPVFAVIWLAIRLDSRGPAIYVQKRQGQGGELFDVYKFRSMYVNSDRLLERHLRENPRVREEWSRFQKIKENDPRLTRVGKFIRKFSLDELPQLFNFFKRNMNLVGPRPYLPRERETIGESFRIISRIKPGITGLWQVRGRNLLSFRDRVLMDEYYIRNWSLWMDLMILMKTVKVLLTREGAF